jgi:hypothetical protein
VDLGGSEMPYKEEQRTLMGFLGIPIVTKVAKTRVFGGPYIRFYDLFEVLSYLYMTGAVLGCARRSKLRILAKMLSVPGNEKEFMNWLQEQAKERLEKFRNELGKEPDRFDEFILFRELEGAIGLNMEDWFKAFTEGDTKIMRVADEKVPLDKAEPVIKKFQLEGIGFGSSFPELTEKMYRNTFENIDTDTWADARAHGLAISEKPTMLSLEEQEEIVLQMVASYTLEYYPELLDSLNLNDYLIE